MADNYFLTMLQNLRREEEILLYNNILGIEEYQTREVSVFLQQEYEDEAIDYPHQVPDFDSSAALWAANIVYISAQLILYRKHKEVDLASLLPDFNQYVTAGTILSADLCLRFLPDMLVQLKVMDSEDKLIVILENILIKWHYSGVQYPLDKNQLNFTEVVTNNCLMQLYSNRIIKYKNIDLAALPAFKKLIAANLGMYMGRFWDDFKKLTIDE